MSERIVAARPVDVLIRNQWEYRGPIELNRKRVTGNAYHENADLQGGTVPRAASLEPPQITDPTKIIMPPERHDGPTLLDRLPDVMADLGERFELDASDEVTLAFETYRPDRPVQWEFNLGRNGVERLYGAIVAGNAVVAPKTAIVLSSDITTSAYRTALAFYGLPGPHGQASRVGNELRKRGNVPPVIIVERSSEHEATAVLDAVLGPLKDGKAIVDHAGHAYHARGGLIIEVNGRADGSTRLRQGPKEAGPGERDPWIIAGNALAAKAARAAGKGR